MEQFLDMKAGRVVFPKGPSFFFSFNPFKCSLSPLPRGGGGEQVTIIQCRKRTANKFAWCIAVCLYVCVHACACACACACVCVCVCVCVEPNYVFLV